jgi:2-succinyl-6-hydroxy-2,4-cyclohexadiene-1-carboxylate synthase
MNDAFSCADPKTFATKVEVLVFIHGFANTSSQWSSTLTMLPPALAHRATWVALPGHVDGPKADTTWDGNLAIIREQVARLAQANCVRMSDTVLVGYSLGARVALGLLAQDSMEEPIAGAVLISCHPGLTDDAQKIARQQDDLRWANMLQDLPLGEFIAAWTAQPIFVSQQLTSIEARRLRQHARLRHHGPSLARAMNGMSLGNMPSYWKWLAAADNAKRATWIVGAQDVKFSQLANELHIAQDATKIHSIANAGHDPTLEQPAALAATMTRILSQEKS